MANRFAFEVTAVDKYTKVFRDLNNKASKAVRPLVGAQRSIAALGREMHLPGIAKAMSRVAGQASSIAGDLGIIGPGMGMAFGGGVVATIGAAAAGMAYLGNRTAQAGLEIGRTARALSMNTESLQLYRGAAEVAGVGTEAATGAFMSLQDAIYGAAYGDREAELMFNKLGVAMKKNKDGTYDVAAAYDDLTRAVAGIKDPHTQAVVARQLGIEALLPLLREGVEGLDRYKAAVASLHGVIGPEAIRDSQKYTEQLNLMKIAWDALANREGAKIFPVMTKVMNWMNGLNGNATVGDVLSGRVSREAIFGRTTTPEQRRSSGVVQGMEPSLAIKRNNPGNIRDASGKGFASYESPTAGLSAMASLIGVYNDKYGLNTVKGIVSRYAPPSENNTGAYVTNVSNATGFGPNQKIDVHDPKVLAPLLSAMVKQEQGKQPFSQDQLNAAAQQVQVNVHVGNAPAGTRVEAKSNTGGFVPTKVAYAMPSGSLP